MSAQEHKHSDCTTCMLNAQAVEDFKERCTRHHEELERKFNRFEKVIFGNGQAGLVTKVENMQQTLPEMREDIKKASRVSNIMIAIAAILQPVFVAILIKHFVK